MRRFLRIWIIPVLLIALFAMFATPASGAANGPGALAPSGATAISGGAGQAYPVSTAAMDLEAFLQQEGMLDYGDVGISDNQAYVILYWYGQLPGVLTGYLQQAAWRDLVQVQQVSYSPGQLQADAERAVALEGVTAAAPTTTYSGVEVQFSSHGQKPLTMAALDTLGVPVFVGPDTLPAATSRDGDYPPPYGGDLVKGLSISKTGSNGGVCSLGVTVKWGNSTGITTANHCGYYRWVGYSSKAQLGVGSTSMHWPALDTQVLSGNGGLPYVNTGPWNGNTIAGVYRGENPPNGINICTSGGVTGELCVGWKMRVRTVRAYIKEGSVSVGPGFWLSNVNQVNNTVQCAAQPGDSGSPTYSYNSNGSVTVYGFVTAGDQLLSTNFCPHNPAFPALPPPNAPSMRVFAVNITEALSSVHVTLATYP